MGIQEIEGYWSCHKQEPLEEINNPRKKVYKKNLN